MRLLRHAARAQVAKDPRLVQVQGAEGVSFFPEKEEMRTQDAFILWEGPVKRAVLEASPDVEDIYVPSAFSYSGLDSLQQ